MRLQRPARVLYQRATPSSSRLEANHWIVTVILLMVVSGCQVANRVGQVAGLGSMVPWTPPEQVVGPDSAFMLRTPKLLTPGARVSTKRNKTGEWTASFGDDLCREWNVIVYTDTTVSLEEKVRAGTRRVVEKDKVLEVVERTDTLEEIGEAIFVRYRVPKGAPCTVTQAGGWRLLPKTSHPDAEIAHYFFRQGEFVFHVFYGRPLYEAPRAESNPDFDFGMRVGPAETVLRDFVMGIVVRR